MLNNNSLIFLFLVIFLASPFAQASQAKQEGIDKGRMEYKARCMHCHGENADGKGFLINVLKVVPADLTLLNKYSGGQCVTEKVLKAVLGRHKMGSESAKMPLLKDVMTLDKVYYISEYIKSVQK